MMRSKFDEQLDRLNKEMMKMGSAIEDSIRKAVDALVKQDEIGRASCRERV